MASEKTEHVEKLLIARDAMLNERRYLANAMSEFDRHDHEENLQGRFCTVQNTIDAIDRALKDEKYVAEHGKPQSLMSTAKDPEAT